MIKTTLGIALLSVLAGCSSMHSIKSPDANNVDGLTYFLPNKDIIVTVTVADTGRTVSFGVSDAYPDLSTQYLLRYTRNLFGKNEFEVGTTTSGLLNSTAKSKTTNQVTDVFKNIASSIGAFDRRTMTSPTPDKPLPCVAKGTYNFLFKATEIRGSACEFDITITRHAPAHSAVLSRNLPSQKALSGIFYRLNEPYLIEAKKNGDEVATYKSIQFSPSGSATHFLPITRTVFSNNEANFTLSDGMVTQYKQEADGEQLGLFKLPSEILSAYFGAIGSVFDNFKNRDEKQSNAISESIKVELAKHKYNLCIAAIRAGDDKLISQLECGR